MTKAQPVRGTGSAGAAADLASTTSADQIRELMVHLSHAVQKWATAAETLPVHPNADRIVAVARLLRVAYAIGDGGTTAAQTEKWNRTSRSFLRGQNHVADVLGYARPAHAELLATKIVSELRKGVQATEVAANFIRRIAMTGSELAIYFAKRGIDLNNGGTVNKDLLVSVTEAFQQIAADRSRREAAGHRRARDYNVAERMVEQGLIAIGYPAHKALSLYEAEKKRAQRSKTRTVNR